MAFELEIALVLIVFPSMCLWIDFAHFPFIRYLPPSFIPTVPRSQQLFSRIMLSTFNNNDDGNDAEAVALGLGSFHDSPEGGLRLTLDKLSYYSGRI